MELLTIGGILVFVIILSVLVLIHELGHFLTAKKFGIKVEEFGFGFPPRIFGKKIGETIYSINLLPVGGFVKLYGEDDAGGGSLKKAKSEAGTKDLKRAFFARPAWQRALVVLAGVIMNFLLAIVIISYLFSGPGVGVPTDHVRITEVANNSPAQKSGLKVGDEVLAVNGTTIKDTNQFAKIAQSNAGKPMELRYERNGKESTVKITPRKNVPKGEGPLGVGITSVDIIKYPWYKAPFYGTIEVFKFSWMILTGLGGVVGNLATKGEVPTDAAGPVGIAQIVIEAFKRGLVPVLWIAAVLSLNLAVLNILPIPALDGGRLFFILIELITRKKVDPKYETMAHAVGLAVLLGLILLITFFDISRLIAGRSILPEM